jgi:hypothetical protein
VSPKASAEYLTTSSNEYSSSLQDNRQYLALAPDGREIDIPKELFIAFSDFMKTRKFPGSITIDFQRDQIVAVEAVTRKKYPGSA